jgi:hypothetical protein
VGWEEGYEWWCDSDERVAGSLQEPELITSRRWNEGEPGEAIPTRQALLSLPHITSLMSSRRPACYVATRSRTRLLEAAAKPKQQQPRWRSSRSRSAFGMLKPTTNVSRPRGRAGNSYNMLTEHSFCS